ncbi:ABC transporter substrate-binding protein [Salipiger mucosus]|uniref:Sensor protein n=1 Tax=Salipiger mucosus DSM 16094 TaxID=1123237 RepID=S9SL14_9RHOB|nr:ABC transporter substrate-binding protein [Salipiger mucosus]EPX87054.1 Sensor protein [Salipiger mucosus DSM 16094]
MIRLAILLAMLSQPLAAQTAELTAVIGPGDATNALVLRSTTDLAVLGPVIEAYAEARSETRVLYEQWGSNDLRAISEQECQSGQAGADLVISSAAHHMVGLVNEGCASTATSGWTQALAPQLSWRDQLWGVSREPAVVVYNRDLLTPAEVPRSRFDLLDLLRPETSRFAGRVATYDIEESGLGFLFAFIDSLEATTFGGLMEAFGRSGAIATCCSAEIIDGVASGRYLVAYNVLGSYAIQRARRDDRLGVVAPEDYTLILSRAAMIPAGAAAPELARDLLDYLLSPEGRAGLEANDLMIRLDEGDGQIVEVTGTVETMERPIGLDPTLLVAMDADKRELFIRRWRDAFPQPE